MRKDLGSMRKIVINKSYLPFCVSHKAFIRLRELGQPEAMQEPDRGAYWPEAATPREPSLNQCGILIPRADERLVRAAEELQAEVNGHCAERKVVSIADDLSWIDSKVDGVEQVPEHRRTWSWRRRFS